MSHITCYNFHYLKNSQFVGDSIQILFRIFFGILLEGFVGVNKPRVEEN
jgi:hypothetical protein